MVLRLKIIIILLCQNWAFHVLYLYSQRIFYRIIYLSELLALKIKLIFIIKLDMSYNTFVLYKFNYWNM